MNEVPKDVADQALAFLNQSFALMQPYMQALTPTDRRDLPKVADGTEPFLDKSMDYITTNAQFSPLYMNINQVKADYTLNKTLTAFKNTLDTYASLVNDTRMIAGSQAYTGALQYYGSLKEAAKRRVPGAKTILEDLRKRFEKNKTKKTTADTSKTEDKNMTAVA